MNNAPLSTGRELILNACEGALQIAVTDNEKLICFQEWLEPRRATEILAPAISQICALTNIPADSFRRIGCFAGPGSFTGIRLVLTTAAAMRRVSRARLAQLDYLQALATTAAKWRELLYPVPVFVITHARSNLVHCQKFISYGPLIPAQPEHEVELIAPASALARLAAQPCYVCGSALARYPDLFGLPVTGAGPKGAPEAVLMPELIHPSAAALCLLARHGDYFPNDVEPRYVRGCDAVENLAKAEGPDSKKLQELERRLQAGIEQAQD